MLNPDYKEAARIENLRMQLVSQPSQAIVGRNYGRKVDLIAVAYDAVKTRDAWTALDLTRKMKIKEEAADQLLRSLVKEGHLVTRQLHGETIYELTSRNTQKPMPYAQYRATDTTDRV